MAVFPFKTLWKDFHNVFYRKKNIMERYLTHYLENQHFSRKYLSISFGRHKNYLNDFSQSRRLSSCFQQGIFSDVVGMDNESTFSRAFRFISVSALT